MWIGWCFSNVFVTIGPPFGRSIHQVLAFWGRCNLAKKISGTRRFGGHKKNAPNEEMKKKATQIVRNQKDRKRETWEDNGNLWIFMMEIDGLMDFFISDKHFGSEHGVHPGIVGDLLLSKSKEKHGASPVSMRTWHWKIPHYSDMFR